MASPPPLKVLISGSGIAGSVFAFCLLRAYPKANITIVEKAPGLRLTGASVDIRSNAVDIIKWAGVEHKIREASTKETGMAFVDGKGHPFATMLATGRTDVQSVTSEFEIFRGALAHVFMQPVLSHSAGVRVLYDEKVDHYAQTDKEVVVTFAKSGKTESYDLLVGADGYYSKIRGAMLGAPPQDQVHGEGVHVAYFTLKQDLLRGSKLAKGHNAPGGRCVVLRPDPDSAGKTRAMLINATWSSDKAGQGRLDSALRASDAAYMDLMDELFHDAGWLAPEILKGMRESDDFYCSHFAQTRSPKLQDGRVVLLGDAGHALPGMGTSLAMTGAYVLAGELLRSGGNEAVGAAAKAYEDLMLPFAQKQQSGDVQFAMQLANPQTWWGISIRNMILRVVIDSGLLDLGMRASAWFGFTEAKLKVPDYPWPPYDESVVSEKK